MPRYAPLSITAACESERLHSNDAQRLAVWKMNLCAAVDKYFVVATEEALIFSSLSVATVGALPLHRVDLPANSVSV